MMHNGWANANTALLAEWIARSNFRRMIIEVGGECVAEAFGNAALDRNTLVDLLASFLSKRIPTVLGQRLAGMAKEYQVDDADAFILPLASIGLHHVDWKQIGLHWAENLVPTEIEDEDEQPGTFAG